MSDEERQSRVDRDDDELSDLEEEELPTTTRRDLKSSNNYDDENNFNDEQEEELDEATKTRRDLERRMDEALKTKKKKKKLGEDDLEQMQDEKISSLREKMQNAAAADAECIRNGQSATHKLKLLPEARDILQRSNLADSILDNNMLEVMRMWLEPLPDGSLPGFSIQKELFLAAERLPIKSIHLRESGLGKVVLFYQKSKRPQLEIKRLADKLIGNWTRPIMGRSDNYRDKFIATAEYDRDDQLSSNAAVSSAQVKLAQRKGGATVQEEAAMRRNRAHIPTGRAANYEIAPRSVVQGTGNISRNGMGNDERFKSLRQKLTQRNVKGVGKKKR